jgi:putative alpha-1,2-mannosidase
MSMNRLLLLPLVFLAALGSSAQPDYARQVDPRIGTEGSGLGSGYTFIGATYPFGMVQFTPTYFARNKGFVINQLSGAGCAHLGNFPTLPLAGALTRSPRDMTGFAPYKTLKKCHAGYFSVEMEDGVTCNATVTRRTAVAQFVFPDTHPEGTVLIGAGIIGSASFYNAHVRVTAPNRCEGFAEGGDFCGVLDTKYRIYFVAEFNRPAAASGTWKDNDIIEGQMAVGGANSGAWFTFDTTTEDHVEYKISISYVSAANARENLARDANKNSFASLREATEAEWNRRLGALAVRGDDPDRVVQFYTHLYHALIHPNISSDVNGEYMGADSSVHRVRPGRDGSITPRSVAGTRIVPSANWWPCFIPRRHRT